jgi:hypothetical protein
MFKSLIIFFVVIFIATTSVGVKAEVVIFQARNIKAENGIADLKKTNSTNSEFTRYSFQRIAGTQPRIQKNSGGLHSQITHYPNKKQHSYGLLAKETDRKLKKYLLFIFPSHNFW